MSRITIVIPIHEVNDELKALYKNAIGSIPLSDEGKSQYPVIVVGPKKVIEEYKDEKLEKVVDIEYLANAKSDFQNQIDAAAKACKTDFFSILEVDDSYNSNWFKNVEEHIDALPAVSFFLPLTEVFDVSEAGKPVPVGFANEIALTTSFSDKIGYIGIEELQEYSDFNATGGVFKTSDFLAIGGLKPKLKIVFWYEFLMRAAENHKEAYVIPKLGYKHNLRRKGSLMEIVSTTIDDDEAKFWYDVARHDYFFNKEREDSYYTYEK